MILLHTSTGFGVKLFLTNPEAKALHGLVAGGKSCDHVAGPLREELLKQLGLMLYRDGAAHLRLPWAAENVQAAQENLGIVKLILQAQANPAVRVRADAILREMAAKIGRMLDEAQFQKGQR